MTTAKDIMTQDVITVDINKGLTYLIKIMADSKVSSILISEHDQICGIVTERDLIKKILVTGKDPKRLTLEEVMTKGITSVKSTVPVYEISQMMRDSKIRHLPVIDDGKLLGMITQTDIVKETHKIHKENVSFMNWQNRQTMIIIAFFIFLIGYLIYVLVIR